METNEIEEKCYVFRCEASCSLEIVVYAEDLKTAYQNCNLKDCNEFEIKEIQVEDIKDYRIEEE